MQRWARRLRRIPSLGAIAAGRFATQHCRRLNNCGHRLWSVTEKMVKQDATNDNWRLVLADAEVHLASVRTRLHVGGDQTALASKSLTTIKDLAKAEGASVMVLDQAANDFLLVEPESLRDPQFSAACAERAATLSHRREPDLLLTLARADSAAGKRDQARAVANEALALLPAFAPGSAEGNLRKTAGDAGAVIG